MKFLLTGPDRALVAQTTARSRVAASRAFSRYKAHYVSMPIDARKLFIKNLRAKDAQKGAAMEFIFTRHKLLSPPKRH